ncbi:similar to Saccharomyces cerevisiae YOL151W GRE2 3-methylbutanal reductase and NADPH-dependent methylglyoxal reductase (D-lactaldehyde dehydrogenase) [Maudiozyma saulgeensis]|uniref:Similar to Saccharomyces cerevisiae YOL151W GRE2 3-methylbutanal reductase and NADPH-dependent methylglyoxal reductase (D-lactaldehyde dehydrogenase) n=1 Tax=Maudiozyma saulgeensis TaxID=1789683 RepID=A0A1X7RB53_9SACH|nr:similar to Saccharomyces cerevisiae YOL151W GRE2 3-methylbutanal reductase and NADPH-dependent methylglyoxal reductase (D-lactaldehyde dehydrogenase) [Kazachstania saulgeensis]
MSVFVTGATGFLGKHVVNECLEKNYSVIAAVRTQDKGDALVKQFNNPRLTTVAIGDLEKLDAFEETFKTHGKDIKFVIHCASPAKWDIDSYEKDLLIPARNGVLGILESIKKYAADSVERFVMTSSFMTLTDFSKIQDSSVTFNEDSWNPTTWESCQTDPLSAYAGSKTFAEKEAWKFYKENKDIVKFKLSTVIPSYIFGPQVFDEDVHEHLNASNETINQIIHATKMEDISPLSTQCCHVRDVAKSHVLAIEEENLANERLFVTSGAFDVQDILNYLNADFPQLEGKIPIGSPDKAVEHHPPGAVVDNKKTRELLGFQLRTLKDCIDDTTIQVLKHEGRL